MSWYWETVEADSLAHVTQDSAPQTSLEKIDQRHRAAHCGRGGRLSDTLHHPTATRRAQRRAALDHLLTVIDAWPGEEGRL